MNKNHTPEQRVLFVRHGDPDRVLRPHPFPEEGTWRNEYSKLSPVNYKGFNKLKMLAATLRYAFAEHYEFTGAHIDVAFVPLGIQRVTDTVSILITNGLHVHEIRDLPEFSKDGWAPKADPLFARDDPIDQQIVAGLRARSARRLARYILSAEADDEAVRRYIEQDQYDYLTDLRKSMTGSAVQEPTQSQEEHAHMVRSAVRRVVAAADDDQVIAFFGSGAELRFGIDEFRNPGKRSPPKQILVREIPMEWCDAIELRLNLGRLASMATLPPMHPVDFSLGKCPEVHYQEMKDSMPLLSIA